jgi:hypothetical protein
MPFMKFVVVPIAVDLEVLFPVWFQAFSPAGFLLVMPQSQSHGQRVEPLHF